MAFVRSHGVTARHLFADLLASQHLPHPSLFSRMRRSLQEASIPEKTKKKTWYAVLSSRDPSYCFGKKKFSDPTKVARGTKFIYVESTTTPFTSISSEHAFLSFFNIENLAGSYMLEYSSSGSERDIMFKPWKLSPAEAELNKEHRLFFSRTAFVANEEKVPNGAAMPA